MQALKVNLKVANHRLPIHPLKSETFDLPVRGPLPMNQFSTGKFTKEYYNHAGYTTGISKGARDIARLLCGLFKATSIRADPVRLLAIVKWIHR